MGFWKKTRGVVKIATSPLAWIISGFDSKSTDEWVQSGADDWEGYENSSSATTSDNQKVREIEEKFNATNQENDEKIGGLLDEIKELKKRPRENKREMDKNFREIQREIEERNRQMTEQLAQKIDKLEETKNELATELKATIERGDNPTKIIALNEKIKDVNKNLAEANLEKNNFVKKSDIQDLKKEMEKPLWRRIRWSNPFNWIALLAFLIFSYSIFWVINWVRNKLFSSSND